MNITPEQVENLGKAKIIIDTILDDIYESEPVETGRGREIKEISREEERS
jgi:hypothetical protein